MVVIDNVGLLLTDLEYFEKRAALLETRRRLLENRIHGIFVMEEAHPRDLRLPSAEEFSTDLMVHLSFREETTEFKARALEISKARHQYYYRGVHHFSIAGRGIKRDVYLGARNERGPGIHIYPSVAAQLSMARDQAEFTVPVRGDTPIDLGHPDLNAAFLRGSGPAMRSSTVLLAEPGTRATFLALRFLAAGLRAGERVLFVSTREDRDAIRRICQREPVLAPVPRSRRQVRARLPRRLPAPRVHRAGQVQLGPDPALPGRPRRRRTTPRRAARVRQHLPAAGPLPVDHRAAVPDRGDDRHAALPGRDAADRRHGAAGRQPAAAPTSIRRRTWSASTTCMHLWFAADAHGNQPFFRVLKSVGNDYVHEPMAIDWRKG
jgi:KaiC/GvpD/RAD55 family RecA-like ATPase